MYGLIITTKFILSNTTYSKSIRKYDLNTQGGWSFLWIGSTINCGSLCTKPHHTKGSKIRMKAGNIHYNCENDLPKKIALFPLEGALLLPGGFLSLNIFEPETLEMVEDAMVSNRLLGIIQPFSSGTDYLPIQLYKMGCIGRITHYNETGNGQLFIILQGVCRFTLEQELVNTKSYRIALIRSNIKDLQEVEFSESINRENLLNIVEQYLIIHEIEYNWSNIIQTPTPILVNAFSSLIPFTPAEKQALLEAPDIGSRAQTLLALTERSLMKQTGAYHYLN
ncbi:ATP-dependent protease [Bartonella henselae]|uniref:ATP-dependent protease n=2 Tax=Bartonella henselae TaxID=38323 RepID=X5M5M8_BARHN|nr:ATP-dependent protease [Bartonella henselae]